MTMTRKQMTMTRKQRQELWRRLGVDPEIAEFADQLNGMGIDLDEIDKEETEQRILQELAARVKRGH